MALHVKENNDLHDAPHELTYTYIPAYNLLALKIKSIFMYG